MTRKEAQLAVFRLILEGHTRPEILDAIEEWRRGRQGIRTPALAIYQDAVCALETVPLPTLKARQAFVIAAALDLFRELRRIADYTGALRALQLYVRVSGTTPPHGDKPEPTPPEGETAPPPSPTDDSIERLLREIEAGGR